MARTAQQLFDLSGKTALVTGGSRGLGLQMAHALGEAGARIMLSSRKAEDLEQAAAELQAAGIDARWVAADCAREEDIHRLASETLQRMGDVDILINNAGESHAGAFEDTPMDEGIEHMFAVNVFGPLALTKAVLPRMRERRTGTVVMVGSMLSSFPVAFRSTYSATKSALKAYAFALRREVEPYGVRVISVEPGTIATGIGGRRLVHIGEDSPYREEYETVAAATRRNEEKGITAEAMAEQIVSAALADKPKPFYARGNNAPLVFLLSRIAPRQWVLDLTARKHGLGRVRRR